MKLYSLPPSPNNIKVVALAHHLGLELEMINVETSSGANKTPEYLAKNPNGLMPTLQDGDFFLWESNAILAYLAQKAGNTTILPSDPQGNADVWRWMCWGMGHWGPAVRPFMFERLVKPMFRGEPADEAVVKAAEEPFHTVAKVLDAHLANRQFLLGDTMTIADFSIAAPLVYAHPAKLPWDNYQNIQAWYGRMNRLTGWQKAIPQMMAR